MSVLLDSLTKRFGTQNVVDRVSLEVAPGEMFFLLGPSGCGKTTLLRLLAGFLDPDAGSIFFGQDRMNGVPPQKREAALVFQQYALWPHLTVFENVAYGLRVRRLAAEEIKSRTWQALREVQLEAFAERKPGQLSGGQQQRVALARALVVRPRLLLFDEPLSNLDTKLRSEIRSEMQQLQAREPRTCVYVTHDQEEALSLASRIGVMQAGQLIQVGTPRQIYENPRSAFVAGFLGEMNFFPTDHPFVRSAVASRPIEGTEPTQVGFRPQHVQLGSEGNSATVRRCTYLGSKTELILSVAGTEIKAWVPEPVPVGTTVRCAISRWQFFPS